jgi:hypothetical protein
MRGCVLIPSPLAPLPLMGEGKWLLSTRIYFPLQKAERILDYENLHERYQGRGEKIGIE